MTRPATTCHGLRTSDALQAGRLQDELDTLREDVIYLKVKLRKESSVSRAEYTQLRDQLPGLARARARGIPPGGPACGHRHHDSGAAVPPVESVPIYDDRPRPTTTTRQSPRGIPVGQEIDVRIQTELTSDNAQVEDWFEATTLVDLYQGDRVLIPAGSLMRGLVTSVNRASRTDRKGSLTVAFNQITVGGRNYPMRGTVTEAIESSGIKGEIGRIGAGSAVGAIIGGIIGGAKGALPGRPDRRRRHDGGHRGQGRHPARGHDPPRADGHTAGDGRGSVNSKGFSPQRPQRAPSPIGFLCDARR